MTEQELRMSASDVFKVFTQSQESFDEAKKKNSDESSKRVNYLRFDKDGTYTVRILPLAPVIDSEGNVQMDRKGYEYPLRSFMLKIVDPSKVGSDKKSKPIYVSVCHVKQALPRVNDDLIDVYLAKACELYADDEKLVKKLRGNSFDGGLKWDSKRCMYVIDCDNRGDGIQILQLSFAQYKELEERKLNLWAKLNKKQLVGCPLSSIENGYPLEVTRKNENGKTSYSFNIDTISGVDVLEEDTLNALLDAKRLPEVLYRYTRYHLEATIAYLQQIDEKYDISVMNTDEVKECIETIKMHLPADDQSHFSFGKGATDNHEENEMDSLDALWAIFDKLDEANLGDDSEEGQELRASIHEFIQANKLPVKMGRSKTNQDLLDECEKCLALPGDEEEEEPVPAPAPKKRVVEPEPEEEEDYDDEPQTSVEEDDEEEEPVPARRSRNDDTNEPAARPARRAARPQRRR